VKRCIIEGCTNQVVKGGVCTKHGAKVQRKLCSSEGCTNIAQKGGVCTRHVAFRNSFFLDLITSAQGSFNNPF
jgi:hypothetical protein